LALLVKHGVPSTSRPRLWDDEDNQMVDLAQMELGENPVS